MDYRVRWDRYLLRQRVLQLLHDHAAQVPDHVFQGFSSEYSVWGVGLAWCGHQDYSLLADAGCEFFYCLLLRQNYIHYIWISSTIFRLNNFSVKTRGTIGLALDHWEVLALVFAWQKTLFFKYLYTNKSNLEKVQFNYFRKKISCCLLSRVTE